MITTTSLITNFERDASYLRDHLAGLTHADSLLQPPVNGNCINWILGHIVCYRGYTLQVCDLPPVINAPVTQRYARDTAPVTGEAADVADFAELVQAYWTGHEQLLVYLRAMTPEQASETVTVAGFTLPRAELLTNFMRHESYHAGQFELLRELALAAR